MTRWQQPSGLDRCDEHRRDADRVARLWSEHGTGVVRVDQRGSCSADDDSGLRLDPPTGEFDRERHFLLGTVEGRAVFATEWTEEFSRVGLRALMAQAGSTQCELAVTAVGLINWHRNASFCPRDGSATTVRRGGLARWCPRCEREIFPRTDSAVIVAVVDDHDRLLLAHQRVWDGARVSVLAGFVEVGESFEQAVHREIAEEASVSLADLRYFGSQPWPFPQSLMVGFFARAVSTEITVDGEEIEWARWYSRSELTTAVEQAEVILPGSASIARRLIRHWWQTEQPIPDRW